MESTARKNQTMRRWHRALLKVTPAKLLSGAVRNTWDGHATIRDPRKRRCYRHFYDPLAAILCVDRLFQPYADECPQEQQDQPRTANLRPTDSAFAAPSSYSEAARHWNGCRTTGFRNETHAYW
ncbi:hypothetical protein CIHG_03103 [Coccidioides immitis H538.4]|uniref:Uncharacterized protein n=1 Tax=Coccidioides immitis H538.4 TaxID=396776 RepID=A0A0J8RMV0_COCIT|nr:hypothetical protein CIHG_03103 [Coccidioides immitis H538.4]